MASDPEASIGTRVSAPFKSPPRDRILTQVTDREGWTGDRRAAIDELCTFVSAQYPDADLRVLRWRLTPLFTKTIGMVALCKINDKKAATFIRDAIVALRDKPSAEAIDALQNPDALLRNYLDGRWEAEDARVGQPSDLSVDSEERAARRHALATDLANDVLPKPRSGPENPWATVAGYVAELLADVTGREPKRTWDDDATADGGWPLDFFRRFAALAVPTAKPPRLDRVWRNALEARREINAAI